jgi:transposase
MMTTPRTGKVWPLEDKVRIVLESLNTNISIIGKLCIEYALSQTVFYEWREKFIRGGKLALSQER